MAEKHEYIDLVIGQKADDFKDEVESELYSRLNIKLDELRSETVSKMFEDEE